MNKKILLCLVLLGVLALPIIASADNNIDLNAGFGRQDSNFSLTAILKFILDALWIIFSALAVIMFVVAGILFLTAQGAPEKLQTARQALIWGVVGVVVAIVAYSIIQIVSSVISTGTVQ